MTIDTGGERLDDVIGDLRELRESTGVSYRELASRIAAHREQSGRSAAEARIAHTTVSDVFRAGRSRVNADLVVEVVRALTGDEAEAARWRARAVRARAGSGEAAPVPLPPPLEQSRMSVRGLVILVVAGVFINSTGKFLNPLLGDMFFFDMVGTAVVALLAGPWFAALTGVLFIGAELLKGEVGGALFAVTMVTAGLVWGFGAKRFGMARTLPRFLILSGAVAVVTSAIAVPIIVLYYGGYAGRGLDGAVSALSGGGLDAWFAVGGSNLTVSLVDKLLVGAIAFAIVRLWARTAGARGISPVS